MGIYEDLGVQPILNASAALTRLGGSRMAPEVIDAMAEASRSFVDMFELQRAVSREIAALVDVPAAYVCSGAASGIVLSLWACMTGSDLVHVGRFVAQPQSWPTRRVIIHAAQRNPYDRVLALAHAQPVVIGDVWQTFDWELEGALVEETAAVIYFAGDHVSRGALPLEDVIRIAHGRGTPVVVDAAAQAIPAANLSRFVAMGADLVLFSGGKALAGPQGTGLIVGRPDLVAAIENHGAPHQRLGRPMKVAKEELVGLLAAIRVYLARDEAFEIARWEATVAVWIERLGRVPGVSAERNFPGEAGLPIPRVRLTLDPTAGLDAIRVEQHLLSGRPPIAVIREGSSAILVAPDSLTIEEADIVAERLVACLAESAGIAVIPGHDVDE